MVRYAWGSLFGGGDTICMLALNEVDTLYDNHDYAGVS